MAEWQEISTAPKDGTVFLALRAGLWAFPAAVCWERPSSDFDDGSHEGMASEWVYADWLLHAEAGEVEVTHWMPLPDPPTLG